MPDTLKDRAGTSRRAETIYKLADRSIPLLTRLRLLQANTPARAIMHEAAARIEELEAALRDIEEAECPTS